MSHSDTSRSLFTRSLQDDSNDSLLWDRWTGKSAQTSRLRVFYPNVRIPAERFRLFLRFELSLALATADKPSDAWIRKFDKLLEKAYMYFGVEPDAVVVKEWLNHDVATIVQMIAAHPAGRKLPRFSDLAQRLVEMEEAFPDDERLKNLKTLLINIGKSVDAIPQLSTDQSPDAAQADMVSFVALDGELDEDLREVWDEHMNSSDMEIDSTLLHPVIHATGSLTEPVETDETSSVENSTDGDGADRDSGSPSRRQQARTRSPRAANRPRSSRPQSEGSGERPGSPLAAQETGGSGGGKPNTPKRKLSHASQGSLFTVPGSPFIKSNETWSAEVQSLKEKLAEKTQAFETERRLMREQLETERASMERERANWERERELLTAVLERERESHDELVATLKERVAELKAERQKAR
ncbi:hypothetical protein K466DRAFT_604839 [Polyporus arcularius HHB13444]|uniref:Uncharacterized protein n=1 Tax=Polyporus arcularius HHB13444 TaxID=1314778 RepID=A0A5C3NUM1_9APHY|nr:hypothetical protein K466DRAFT_604839 [Polyporus arcularius HHB13444]